MSLWKSLFGAKSEAAAGDARPTATEAYKGYTIEARPYAANGQFQVAGTITKEIDGAMKSHSFVRADLYQSVEDAAACAIRKGRLIIDQNGDSVLS